MLLKRIMPCLLVQDGRLVKTVRFENPQYVGDPINAVKIYNDKEVDELVLLDINASKKNQQINWLLLQDFAAECFMPLAYGGGVRTLEDFKKLYSLGLEKIIVNTLIFDNPDIIKEAVQLYGSQSVIASVDFVKDEQGVYSVFSHSDRNINKSLVDFLEYVKDLGVGEILVTSVNREGTWDGYDLELMEEVDQNVNIPLIANGGCGKVDDLKEVLYGVNIQAAALGSMAVYQKKGMGVLIRFPKREQIIKDE